MPSIYQFSEIEMLAFFLVFLRMISFIYAWPVFGVMLVPNTAKILFSLTLALMIFPVMNWQSMPLMASLESMQIVWLALKEIFIGLSFGFLARLFFFAMNIAGEIISVSMGLSSAQLFNPSLGERSSANSQFLVILASLFYLAIQGHHLFLAGMVQSFSILPLSEVGINFASFEHMGIVMQEIMVVGVKMCAPVMIAILFMNLSMAVIGRAVPQINVLITSLPVNILVGFLILLVSLPLVLMQMDGLLQITASRLFQMLKTF